MSNELLRRFIHAAGSYVATLDSSERYDLFFSADCLAHCLFAIYTDVCELEAGNKPYADFVAEVIHDYTSSKSDIKTTLERLNELEECRKLDDS